MENLPIMELISCLWNCTTEHSGYICFEGNLNRLKMEMEELEEQKNDLMRRVEMEERKNMKRLSQVEGWISRVEIMRVQVDELVTCASEEIESNCLGGCCPKNCWSRYKMGKKVEEKLRDVTEHKKKGEFNVVATPLEEAYDRVLRYLGEEEKGIIGLYGDGGVGKTAQLIQICSSLVNSRSHFDFVIWAVISQDLDFEKIQGDIGKAIGFLEDRWKDKSQNEKAIDLFRALSQKRYVLLLDDLWERIDVAKVGVPLPSRENGSKLVFTTRSEEVCTQMGAEEKIRVGRLRREKAFNLFQENVGDDTLNSHPDILKHAEKIAEMCDGLPLALKIIGRAMAYKKAPEEWQSSIEALSKSALEFSGTGVQDFSLLKFGYDSLPNNTVKSCFLYCALYPEDFIIKKSDLIDYWVGEEFFVGSNDKCGVQSEGLKIIRTLLDACLLEEAGEDVKMHDLIREMALWISCEFGKTKDKYLVAAGAQLLEVPEVGKWEVVRRMSLMANHIQFLMKSPRCNNLLTLLLRNNHLKTIVNSFFDWMPSLKVLDLSENRELTSFPSGILRLDSLQYLNFSRTGIAQLPIELKNLVNLKCLNLEHTYELQTIPFRVLSNFSKLVVLRLVHCASSDRVVSDGIQAGGHESMARDMQSLKWLNVLTITIRSEYSLRIFASYSKFQTCTTALCLHHLKYSRSLDISILGGMDCVDDLEFIDCKNLEQVSINGPLVTKGKCFNSLHRVSIINCSKLMDLTWLTVAPNLQFITVSRCSSLEIICEEYYREGNPDVLAKLEALKLVSLPKLKSIYPGALPFPCLKEIIVDECPKLKKLPLNADSAKGQRIIIQGWDEWWNQLEWQDDASQRTFLPCFKACLF